MKTELQRLFNKIENCDKWIAIHKKNRFNPDTDVSFCNNEIKRIQKLKREYQRQFDNLYYTD